MKRAWIVVLTTAFLLASCSEAVAPTTAEEATSHLEVLEDTPTPFDAPTPTGTEIASETPAPTLTPTTPPSPMATWVIPTPSTLTLNDAKRLARIPSGPEGCLPPCWNGLTPGESPASDIPAFLAQLGIEYSVSINGLDEHDRTLHYTQASLPEVNIYYLMMHINWRETVESVSLSYQFFTDIYGESSYLHPQNLVKLLGQPDTVKIYTYKDWGGGIGLIFSDDQMAVSYSADITRSSSGEPLLCLKESQEDPLIAVLLFDEEHDHEKRFLRPELYDDQETYTGLSLSDFIAELVIPRRCIPITLPD